MNDTTMTAAQALEDLTPAQPREYYPATSQQRRIFALHNVDDATTAYNMSMNLPLHPSIGIETAQRFMNWLIERHESLRTSFLVKDGQILQQIHGPEPFEIEEESIERTRLDETMRAFVRPFDLSKAPLMRAKFVTTETDEKWLLLDMHHVVGDQRSLEILGYDAERFVEGVELEPVKLHYKDYAVWQQEGAGRALIEQQKAHWLSQFEDLPEVLELQGDYPRPAILDFQGASLRTVLSGQKTRRLEEFCRRMRVSPNMALFALFKVLLFNYTRQEDLVIGIPVLGRDRAGLQEIMGMFVNTLALRSYPQAGKRFSDFLQEIKGLTLEALQNQLYPFEELMDALRLERDPSRNPLFDILFQYQRGSAKNYVDINGSAFDLTLSVFASKERLVFKWIYRTRLFKESTIRRMAAHLERLLDSALEDPDQRLEELEIVTGEERSRLLGELRKSESPAQRPVGYGTDPQRQLTLPQWFERQVEATPDAVALVYKDRHVSYRELNARANRLAWYLRKVHSVGAESLVAVSLERSIDMLVALLGVLKAGGAYTPIDPHHPRARTLRILEDCGAGLLLCAGSRSLDEFQGTLVNVSDERLTREFPSSNPPAVNTVESLAYVIYTSGSTGRPKGAALPHRATLNTLRHLQKHYPAGPGDAFLFKTTFTFDVSAHELFGWYFEGGRLVIPEPGLEKEPNALAGVIEREEVTHLCYVPSALQSILSALDQGAAAKLRTLKYIMLAGETFSRELFDRLRNLRLPARLENLYGPTETAIYTTGFPTSRHNTPGKLPIGKPFKNTGVLIFDARGRLAPLGIIGEIYLSGACQGRCYFKAPGLTAEKFLPHPFADGQRIYRSGDLGRWLEDGNLEFHGRSDHQVKVRGYRIELGEIENAIELHPDVRACTVTTRKKPGQELYLCAYAAVDEAPEVADLRAYLRRLLPEYMLPGKWVFLDEIPLTSSGKADRKALPAPPRESRADESFVQPETRIQQLLCRLWEEVLQTKPIGLDDNFFVKGGHSLRAVALASKVQEKAGQDLTVMEVFQNPTVRAMSAVIESRIDDQGAGLATAGGKVLYPASAQQQRLYALQQLDLESVAFNLPVRIAVDASVTSEAVRGALDRLAHRHESLRTFFVMQGGDVFQGISEKPQFEVRAKDSQGADERTFKKLVRPFDLSQAPLLRAALIEEREGKKRLFLDQHQIISDSRSLALLLDELRALMRGEELQPVRLQYKDYAVWQQEGQGHEAARSQKSYWMEQFSDGSPPILDLPTDFPRPSVQQFAGRSTSQEIEGELAEQLEAFCSRRQVTADVLLLAVFKVLLARCSGQDDFAVGLPVEGRDVPGAERVLGAFGTTLALRTQPRGERPFTDYLQSVRECVSQGLAHQQYPFEELVEALPLERDPGRNPLLDTLFDFRPAQESPECQEVAETTHFDLALKVVAGEGSLVLTWQYMPHLFLEETVSRWAAHLLVVLPQVLENPETRLRDLRLLTAEEQTQLLESFNFTPHQPASGQTVVEEFRKRAGQQPHPEALVQGRRGLSYGELNQLSDQGALLLRRRFHIGPEKVVGLLAERSPEMISAIWSVLKAGGAYLPIDPELPDERIDFMLSDSGAALLLTEEEQRGRSDFAGPVLDLNKLAQAGQEQDDIRLEPPAPDSAAYVIYTSGSTGRPKGTVVEHASLLNLCRWHIREFEVTPQDQATALAGLSFDASVWELFPNLLAGACLHLLGKKDLLELDLLNDYFHRHHITIAFMPTHLGELFMEQDNRSLRALLVGGDTLTRSPEVRYTLYNLYGPTENTVVATCAKLRGRQQRPPIGRPIDNVEVLILTPEGAQLQPVGAPGELCIGGLSLARGYLNRPDLTEAAFVPHPFRQGQRLYRTGDWARWMADGQIDFLGRRDSQVQLRGYRIELGEIESALAALPGVERCLVSAVEADRSKALCAYVAVGEGTAQEELQSALAQRLPGYMTPSFWIFLESFPLTPNGKIDRRALPLPQVEPAGGQQVQPKTEEERQVSEIWKEVLGVKSLGIRDNFFQLGGHSLRAVHMVARIKEVLKGDINVVEVFQNPTVEALAGLIASREKLDESVIERARTGSSYPASSQQQRLYALHQLGVDSKAYNIPSYRRLPLSLTFEKTRAILQALVDRHEVLRTAFFVEDGSVRQYVKEDLVFELESGSLQAPEEMAQAMAEFGKPFDLEQAPLMRAKYFHIEGRRPWLALDFHHIISDAQTHRLIEGEAMKLAEGRELPPLRLQYKDYALWQQEGAGRRLISKQRRFWLDLLSGTLPVLNLPADYPRPAILRFEGVSCLNLLDEASTARMRAFCRKQEVTPYMLCLTVFKILLAKYAGQEDLIVGTPVEGRDQEGLHQVAGMFVNTLALRSRPQAGKRFAAYLEEVKDLVLRALEHQQYPFEELIEELKLERDPSRNPLFDVIFHLLTDVEVEEEGEEYQVSKFDLALTVFEGRDRWGFFWHYSRRLFEESTVRRMARGFLQLLEHCVAQPRLRLGSLSPTSPAEEDQLLTDFNKGSVTYDPSLTVLDLFEDQAAEHPHRVALFEGEHHLTYRVLNRRAGRMAQFLAEHHSVGPERIVAVQAPRCRQVLTAILGILKAGGAYLPLDPALPPQRVRRILEDSGACLLITRRDDSTPDQCAVLDLEDEAPFQSSEAVRRVPLDPRSLAYVIYTSGSTGGPKGVLVEHRNLSAMLAGINQTFAFRGDQRYLLLANLAFDASVRQIFAPLTLGAQLHLAGDLDLEALAAQVEASQITVLNSAPKILLALAQSLKTWNKSGRLLLETVISGGEALSNADFETIGQALAPQRFFNSYGPSETTINAAIHLCGQQDAAKVVPIGKPVPNNRVHLLKGDDLGALGMIGEICISGEGVSRGYLNRPSLTAQRFVPHALGEGGARLYRSGDLGRWRPSGVLEFHGRSDDQVKLRGYRIELGEIENEIASLSEVSACAVLLRKDRGKGEAICAYVVAQDGTDAAQLRRHLLQRLPDYMIPAHWVFLRQLPLNASGKVDRQALPAPEREDGEGDGFSAPQNELETLLCRIWEESLGLERVGARDNFFDLGGHSLKAVHMVSRIRQALQREVSMIDIFLNPTVQELGLVLAERKEKAVSPIVPVEGRDSYPASSQQKRLFALQQLEPDSIAYNMCSVWPVPGSASVESVEAVINQIMQRHEALRTSFSIEDGQVVQHIHQHLELKLERRKVEHSKQRLSLGSLMGPFDLEKAPLMKGLLLEYESGQRWLFLDQHHIIGDARSAAIIRKEVDALSQGRSLPPVALQYKDYAVWREEGAGTSLIEEQKAYWLREFEEAAPPLLALPTDFPRPPLQRFTGRSLRSSIGPELTSRLQAFCRRRAMTTNMALLAVFKILLSQYSGQDDLVVGTVVEGRDRSGLDDVVGMFVNTLALRNRPQEDLTFIEFLQSLREKLLQALENQLYPLEALVDKLPARRDPSRNPLFDVLFHYVRDEASRSQEAEGDSAEEFKISKFDLSLAVLERSDGCTFLWEYASHLFARQTIERMAGHFQVLLEAVLQDSEKPLGQLSMAAAAEEEWMRGGLREDLAQPPPFASVVEGFEQQARRTPDAAALVRGDSVLTYSRLNRQANSAARRLRDRHAVAGEELIAVSMGKGIDLVPTLLGILKAGAAFLPLDPQAPVERAGTILKDCGARLLISDREPDPRLKFRGQVVQPADLCRTDASRGNLNLDLHPRSLAYAMYTSGSTGLPKGVLIEHGSLAPTLAGNLESFGYTADDHHSFSASLTFDASLTQIFCPLLSGGTLHLPQAEKIEDFQEMLDHAERCGFSFLDTVPRLAMELADYMHDAGRKPLKLRRVLCGGDVLWPADAQRIRDIIGCQQLVNDYGPTESTVNATYFRCSQDSEDYRLIPVGRPHREKSVFLLENGRLAAPGAPAEIALGGCGLARGYLGQPAMTAERFRPHPFQAGERLYLSGDLGRWRWDRQLEHLGRIDRQVKISGIRMEPGEVEAALESHPQLSAAAVAVLRPEKGEAVLCAYYVARSEVGENQLRDFLLDRLPPTMIPSRWMALDSMPATASGKVDYASLPAPGEESAAAASESSEKERLLASIWESVLDADWLGPEDNFFEFGLHSLKAVQAVSRIRLHFGISITIRDVFRNPTVRRLSAHIEKGGTKALSPATPVPVRPDYPVSSQQRRLYALHQFEETSIAYNMPAVQRALPSMNAPALESVLNQIIERHEALRTSFFVKGSEVRQRVVEDVRLKVEARKIDRSQLEDEVRAFIQPFDLSRPPLMRAALLDDGEQKWLLFDQHHIVGDGRSADILFREAQSLDWNKELQPVPLQYKDYAVWQQEGAGQELIRQQKDFWLDQFQDRLPESLQLPYDFPRPRVQEFSGGYWRDALDAEQTRLLRSFCRRHVVTPNMALLAVFSALLARYSGQNEVVIGCPTDGRMQEDLFGVIGMFVNTLPLRTSPRRQKSFSKFLTQIKERLVAALDHQLYPFEELVARLPMERDPSRNPLYDVTFQLLQGQVNEKPDDAPSAPASAKFDLSLTVVEDSRRMALHWTFADHLFKPETIHRMAGHFTRLLHSVLEDPEQPLANLQLVDEEEKERLLDAFNATQSAPQPEHSAIALFEAQAARQPRQTALVGGGQTLSYRQLNNMANGLARRLQQEAGLPAEGVVGILAERSLAMAVSILGVLKAGGAFLPIDPESPQERIAFMLRDSGARCLIADPELASRAAFQGPLLSVHDSLDSEISDNPGGGHDLGSLAYVIYTSGSTGRPKGVLIEHRGLANLCQWHTRAFEVSRDDRATALAGLGFDASVWELFPYLTAGAGVHLIDKDTALNLAGLNAYMNQEGISIAFLPTQLGERFMQLENTSLRTLLLGGDRLSRIPSRPYQVVNNYGPTEASVVATSQGFGQEIQSPPIGKPIDHTQVLILQPGGQALQPVRVLGELCIAGISLARGYLNRPQLTSQQFVQSADARGGRLYRTGDLARWNQQGELEFAGRLDNQVKLRGYRIELGEIESLLSQQDSVENAAVTLAEQPDGGEKSLCAYVTGPAEIDFEALETSLSSQLPAYMVPARWMQLDELPLTPNGKLDRRALPQPQSAQAETADYQEPRSEEERELAELWARILGLELVGRKDNFFALGGNSLNAVEFVSALQEKWGIQIPMARIMIETLEELAAHCRSRVREPR